MAYEWYLDANALIKRYSVEKGTLFINRLFDLNATQKLGCSTVCILELISIITRKRNDGRIDDVEYNNAIENIWLQIVENDSFFTTSVNDVLLYTSVNLLSKHNINATDALILRSALNLQVEADKRGDSIIFVSSDKRLVRVAYAEGIIVFDPEAVTSEQFEQLLTASIESH